MSPYLNPFRQFDKFRQKNYYSPVTLTSHMNQLDKIFKPESVAIVGASTKPGSVGNDIVKNLSSHGFVGKIYPVNPKAEELYNLRVYPTLTAINEQVDLVIIVVPAESVPDILAEAGKLNIKGAVIISAGFKEAGRQDLEDKIKEISTRYDIKVIGPNCLGIINPENGLNVSFAAVMPTRGEVAFLSQSGALCTAVLDYANKLNIGFSKFVSVGNKTVVDELALLEYLENDPETKVIAMYVEQLNNADKLISLASRMTTGKHMKPIIAIKSGRTSAGASASASHTGALAGSDAAYDALFAQAGIIRAEKISDLFDLLAFFTSNPIPDGHRTAIITNAGGPGVIVTDECISSGLQLAELTAESIARLKSFLPSFANTHNPIDVLGDARSDRYRSTLEVVSQDPNVDSIIVILTPQSITDVDAVADAIITTKQNCTKPIIASFVGGKLVSPAVAKLREAKVATTAFPEQAARTLATASHMSGRYLANNTEPFVFRDTEKNKVEQIFSLARTNGKTAFPEAEAIRILAAYNFPVLASRVVTSAGDAEKTAREIGGKVVMKIVSPDILHKSDAGGIALNVTTTTAAIEFERMLERVKAKMPKAKIEGVLIAEMIENKGLEIIIGTSRDASLGNMIMVGLGGVFVEIFKDISFGLPPLTKDYAREMISQLKAKKIIDGARGGEPLDEEALLDCLGRLSALLQDFPQIKELDINPLLVLPKGHGVKALDARIILE